MASKRGRGGAPAGGGRGGGPAGGGTGAVPVPGAKRVRTSKLSEASDHQRAVAHHYSDRKDQGVAGREQSRVKALRKFNNWVKSTLIREHMPPGADVLDVCSGKGGDLGKFVRGRARSYTSADHADQSVLDAVRRYNEGRMNFPATFIVADCHRSRVSDALPLGRTFDLVSCQFSLHYSFETEARARGLLMNVTDRMKAGSHFVGTMPDADALILHHCRRGGFRNSICKLTFDRAPGDRVFSSASPFGERYTFDLADSIDNCAEFLVPPLVLRSLAAEYGLELVRMENFHEFYVRSAQERENMDLLLKMEAGNVSREEWEVAGLYLVFVFRMTRDGGGMDRGTDSEPPARAGRVEQSDVIVLE